MSEQKRGVVHDIFVNVHCIVLSNLPWALAQAGLTTSVQAPPYLVPRP